ncbi:Txe/YoeB family addiction module toxin [uncultured Leuconostoc sp.]|uniref:Txe/YoeB family addiction module toxin n=1 Tax=uncultured Leuconostoc sp. TaxID=173262 RepID=UPI0025FDD581|nr:Txe/YoeB family addiction module toxin [uncultured Leuconostoc sp.]
MWQVKFKTSVTKDLVKLKRAGLTRQFDNVYQQLKKNPYELNQRFEKLVPPGAGKYSRRINGQHRVVYSINQRDHMIEILSSYGHY